jgi:hypothetical protein
MSDFPALQPQVRSYTLGQHPSSNLAVLTGEETSVRHTNASTNYFLRLTFVGLQRQEHFAINSHYIIHGRFQPFDLSDAVLAGGGFTFPAGYQWIYAGKPQTSYEPSVITVSVELQLVPPYTI